MSHHIPNAAFGNSISDNTGKPDLMDGSPDPSRHQTEVVTILKQLPVEALEFLLDVLLLREKGKARRQRLEGKVDRVAGEENLNWQATGGNGEGV